MYSLSFKTASRYDIALRFAKSGNNLLYALLNFRMNDFSLPQFEQILNFFLLFLILCWFLFFLLLLLLPFVVLRLRLALFMNLLSVVPEFLLFYNCRGVCFLFFYSLSPVLALHFTTINFSSSQNCILQTETESERGRGRAWQGGGSVNENTKIRTLFISFFCVGF